MKATARRTAEEATRSLADSRVLGHRRRPGGRTLRRLTGGNGAVNGRRTMLALDAAKDVRQTRRKEQGAAEAETRCMG
jgi:hypothetical protein